MSNRHAPKLAGANEQTPALMMSRLRGAAAPDGMEIGVDFPMLCEQCLGDSRFMRMTRLASYSACKITGRPFQPFRWRPSRDSPPRETIIGYEISAEKNICQCCLNDIDYNIPMALREAFEAAQRNNGIEDDLNAKTGANQDFHLAQKFVERAAGKHTAQIAPAYKLLDKAATAVQKVQNDTTTLPPLCLDWIKTGCSKPNCARRPCCGAYAFPELKSNFPQQITQLEAALRARGARVIRVQSTEIAKALLQCARLAAQAAKAKALAPPADQSVTSLYLRGLSNQCSEATIRNALSRFGAIVKVQYNGKGNAFVQFKERKDAEAAVQMTKGRLDLGPNRVQLGWAAKKESTTTQTGETPFRSETQDSPAPATSLPLDKRHQSKESAVPVPSQPNKPPKRSGLHPSVPKAVPLPEIAPGIPIPYGMSADDTLPPAPPCLSLAGSEKHAHRGQHAKRKSETAPIPSSKRQKGAAASCFQAYPSLGAAALAGRLPIA